MIWKIWSSKVKRLQKTNITNKVPIRTCIACRSTDAKHGLIRLVNSPEGILVDQTGKRDGRGAYIHTNHQCLNRILDGHTLSKALRVEIGPDDLLGLKKNIEIMTVKMSLEVAQ